ncbi:MAG: hypothetical protein K8R46_14280, partial [Pirellulales bacterium]|nr:hypothetical protein [Pirellulales bacterium]
VEVSGEGNTISHVFRGSVKVQVVGDGIPSPFGRGVGGEGHVVQLGAGESARVERGEGDPRLVLLEGVDNPPKFVRRLVKPPRLLDLLDIVAGGDGMGWRRECGIDPTTGMEDPMYLSQQRAGDGQYRPVLYQRLIDGVFVPDGGSGTVQLDSAGHTFDGFPRTVGGTLFGIWVRAADVDPRRQARERWHWVYSMGRGEQFMPQGRGMLCLHPNVGITFDLAAIRKLYEGIRPARFRATAGLADAALVLPESDPHGIADLWVFVDGRLKLQRKGLRPKDGTIDVNIELGADDGFLTIAVTDNNCFASFDWTIFGDPVLEMTPTDPENK